jgi:hypothetical protein
MVFLADDIFVPEVRGVSRLAPYEHKNYSQTRLFGKFAEVGAKGTQLKETAWEEVASMINRFVFAHPNIYRNHAFKRE